MYEYRRSLWIGMMKGYLKSATLPGPNQQGLRSTFSDNDPNDGTTQHPYSYDRDLISV
ncbi:hypothetical protein ACYVU7_01465 [Arenicellales bacterium IMCC56312]